MAEEVHVPGAGEVPKKWVGIVGGVAGAYIAFRWYQARQASAAAAAAGPKALPVDTSNTAAGQGATGYSNPGPGAGPASYNSGALTTNAEWSTKVEQDLVGLGYDAQTVATALGLYLSSQPLTGDQQAIIRVAWAMDGKAPETPSLPIIPVQTPPTGGGSTPPPPSGGGQTPPPPPPPNPYAGMHWQDPQVATLSQGRTLRDLAKGTYGVAASAYQSHLNIMVSLNPTEGGPDHPAATTHLIRMSNGRWVPN